MLVSTDSHNVASSPAPPMPPHSPRLPLWPASLTRMAEEQSVVRAAPGFRHGPATRKHPLLDQRGRALRDAKSTMRCGTCPRKQMDASSDGKV